MNDSQITIGVADPGPSPGTPAILSPGFVSATQKRAVGNGTVRLRASSVIGLPNLPNTAQSCLLVLEAAPGADKSAALGRFWLDGTWPNEVQGLPMFHGSVIEITNREDLTRARFFSTDAGNQ